MITPQSTATQDQSRATTQPTTPQVPLQKAFGDGYDVFATAQLAASSFDLKTVERKIVLRSEQILVVIELFS